MAWLTPDELSRGECALFACGAGCLAVLVVMSWPAAGPLPIGNPGSCGGLAGAGVIRQGARQPHWGLGHGAWWCRGLGLVCCLMGLAANKIVLVEAH